MSNEENTNKRPRSSSSADVPFEQIGALTFSPQTDIPFGKPFRMGLFEYTFYDQALKAGYEADIGSHLEFIQDHQGCPPLMLDDKLDMVRQAEE